MRSLVVLTIAAVLAAAAVRADCDAQCAGGNTVSCLYCPLECGTCAANSVVTKCRTPGDVHLSFDDGPLLTSHRHLDIIKAEQVNASFWLLGTNVAGREDIVRRMANDGHYIGTHSWSHAQTFNDWNDNDMNTIFKPVELTQTRNAIQAATGYSEAVMPVHTFRPPFGNMNKRLQNIIQSAGFSVVMWNADTNDWTEDELQIEHLLDNVVFTANPATDSFIWLYHGAGEVSTNSLQTAIKKWKSFGFRFVSAYDCFLPLNMTRPVVPGWDAKSDNAGPRGAAASLVTVALAAVATLVVARLAA